MAYWGHHAFQHSSSHHAIKMEYLLVEVEEVELCIQAEEQISWNVDQIRSSQKLNFVMIQSLFNSRHTNLSML